ncbi:hypothetical protein HPP92_018274 [Vanilla planifolia]|uniref:Fe2OG dioxygenase domain-containing protein n=1 Tax=Vanilla planifolia TaxID=51239 RepID=A0A835QEG2_VANPL|nr:hypothetical protein HPP92_018893 [Vanilla planifolia]KAG0468946.1 hypothetical protein HPP92_018274 [Vanilla planifolia]
MAVETISLPSIDLANFPAELGKLTAAATGMGCFRVSNHGIPVELMTEAKAVASSFSQLPDDKKLGNNDVFIGSGFRSRTAFTPLLESFDWPCTMRLNVYDYTEESIGLQAAQLHTDSGLLTVLLEDEIGGFEVVDQTGKFVAVHPQPGTFLVIIGDVGKVWSNGKLRNVQHQVVCTQAAPRVTIVFNVASPKDGVVEPHAALVDEEHPRLYRPLNFVEYRKLRDTTESRDGSALLLWQADE